MHWVPLIVWIAAVVVALVVLGFCAYELTWKSKRLQRDLAALQSTQDQLGTVGAALTAAQQRASSLKLG